MFEHNISVGLIGDFHRYHVKRSLNNILSVLF